MSYDPPRRDRGPDPRPSPAGRYRGDPGPGYRGRDPRAANQRGGEYREPEGWFGEPGAGYRRPPVGSAPPWEYQMPRDGRDAQPRRGARSASRALLEVIGAVVLVAATAAVTWVAAGHHYRTAQAAAAGASSPAVAAEPQTAAGALAAADNYFALYGAGQYGPVYTLIAPADQAVIQESVWTGLHAKCHGGAVPLSYQVKDPVLSGSTAVVTVSLAGAASATASEQATFTFAGGRWYYVPPDMQVYRGHDLAQAVAAAKADGFCS